MDSGGSAGGGAPPRPAADAWDEVERFRVYGGGMGASPKGEWVAYEHYKFALIEENRVRGEAVAELCALAEGIDDDGLADRIWRIAEGLERTLNDVSASEDLAREASDEIAPGLERVR